MLFYSPIEYTIQVMEFIAYKLAAIDFDTSIEMLNISATRRNEKVVAKVSTRQLSQDKEEVNVHYIFYRDNIIVDQQAISYLNQDEEQMEKDLSKLLYRNNIM